MENTKNARFFSQGLTKTLCSILKDQFGKAIGADEAQQVGLRVAQVVMMKELEKKHTRT